MRSLKKCGTAHCENEFEPKHKCAVYCSECRKRRMALRDKLKFQAKCEHIPVLELVNRAMGNPLPPEPECENPYFTQIPAHAYGPPARCVEDSWSSDTLREKIEHLDKEQKIAS